MTIPFFGKHEEEYEEVEEPILEQEAKVEDKRSAEELNKKKSLVARANYERSRLSFEYLSLLRDLNKVVEEMNKTAFRYKEMENSFSNRKLILNRITHVNPGQIGKILFGASSMLKKLSSKDARNMKVAFEELGVEDV